MRGCSSCPHSLKVSLKNSRFTKIPLLHRQKWGALAACLCLVLVGVTVLKNDRSIQQLRFNEATSVVYSAPLYGTSVSESVSGEEATKMLGFDITSTMPESVRAFDFSYAKMLASEDGSLIGIFVEGYEDASVYQGPGIYMVITFGNLKPTIDYDYVKQDVISNTINGIPIFASIVPEHTMTTDSGVVRTIPALYSVAIDSRNAYFYIESRGTLSEDQIEAVVCGITDILTK